MTPGQPPSLTSHRKISNGLGKSKYFWSRLILAWQIPGEALEDPGRFILQKKILNSGAKSFQPPRGLFESRETATIGGWRVGRNPPSVRKVRFLRKTNQAASGFMIVQYGAFLVLNLPVGLQAGAQQIDLMRYMTDAS